MEVVMKKFNTENVTLEEQAQRLFNVAIKDPEHLKRWLQESGRTWLIFNTNDLVDALPFPDGLDTLIQIIACYRDHRSIMPSGRVEKQVNPVTGKEVEVPLSKSDKLEVAELDRAIRFLINQITETEPSWNLQQPPM